MKRIELKEGDRKNRLTYIKETQGRNGRRSILCKCDCGNTKELLLESFRGGQVQSCGCLRLERMREKGIRPPIKTTDFRIGEKFGMLTIVQPFKASVTPSGRNIPKVLCACDCGNTKVLPLWKVVGGTRTTCGCVSRWSRHTKPDPANGALVSWQAMIYRCSKKTGRKSDKHYFDKGIRVCERWLKYENFLEDMGERPEGASIDRIDNSKGYSPENCRWATSKEQARNTSRNVVVSVDGVSMCLADAEAHLGVKTSFLRTRLKRGWSLERTLATPNLKLHHGSPPASNS